jgi:hypothetical protein
MLYGMAAVATYGKGRQMVISHELQGEHDDSVICAVKMKDDTPAQQLKHRHDNGWAYFEVRPPRTRESTAIVKPLTEDELEECK